jgi:uncharacterized protein YdhG (YjbR/CyaY superfamily)
MKQSKNIDEYISGFPEATQAILETLRMKIHLLVPEAAEKISYGMPTFTLGKNLVHFAAYKGHIGFYPGAAPIHVFKKELTGYKTSKGTVQFSLEKPLPLDLITKMVTFRVEENMAKAKGKVKSLSTKADPFSSLSAPAQRALKKEGITTVAKLAKYTKKEILALHGMGPGSIPTLTKVLASQKLKFKKA